MSKKKFKDTTVGQLLFGAASVINPTLGNVLQGVTSPKEAIEAITKADAPAEDRNRSYHFKMESRFYVRLLDV